MVSPHLISKSNQFLLNIIFQAENNLKIREDFIDVYSTIIKNSPADFKKNFTNQSNFYYYSRIRELTICVNNFNVKKIVNSIKKPVKAVEPFGNVAGFADSIFNILNLVFFIGTLGSFFGSLPSIITILSSIITIFLTICNIGLYLILQSGNVVKGLMVELNLTHADIAKLELKPQKEKLIGIYIWDHSICHNPTQTIRGFLLLLLIKFISKGIFQKIKSGLITIIPNYLHEYEKNRDFSRIRNYIWKDWIKKWNNQRVSK